MSDLLRFRGSFSRLLLAIVASVTACALAGPATRPADDDDAAFLAKKARPASTPKSDAPATAPSPFSTAPESDARQATLTSSDGSAVQGKFSHTAEKPFRVWVEEKKEYRDIPFKLIARLEAKVTNEHDEKEWHFKESGSDIKEFTGKTYPVRETLYTLTLVNGQTVTGGIVEPLYLERPNGRTTYSLLKTDKGQVGQTLSQLVYVRRVDFDDAK